MHHHFRVRSDEVGYEFSRACETFLRGTTYDAVLLIPHDNQTEDVILYIFYISIST